MFFRHFTSASSVISVTKTTATTVGKKVKSSTTSSIGKAEKVAWRPKKLLRRDKMQELRQLHQDDPTTNSREVLSKRFGVSYEAVKRILKSKWQPLKSEEINWK